MSTIPVKYNSIGDRKPIYALLGANDLAVEKLRELPAKMHAMQADLQDKSKDLPSLPKSMIDRANELTDKAEHLYTKLAIRGERLVASVRRQPSTEAAIDEAKEAVRKTRAAGVAAKRSAKAAEHAVEDAATKIG